MPIWPTQEGMRSAQVHKRPSRSHPPTQADTVSLDARLTRDTQVALYTNTKQIFTKVFFRSIFPKNSWRLKSAGRLFSRPQQLFFALFVVFLVVKEVVGRKFFREKKYSFCFCWVVCEWEDWLKVYSWGDLCFIVCGRTF